MSQVRDFARVGSHTWDLHLEYHRCPSCGFIEENRQTYEERLGRFEKDLSCIRCKHQYTVQRKFRPLEEPTVERSENG